MEKARNVAIQVIIGIECTLIKCKQTNECIALGSIVFAIINLWWMLPGCEQQTGTEALNGCVNESRWLRFNQKVNAESTGCKMDAPGRLVRSGLSLGEVRLGFSTYLFCVIMYAT